MKITMTLEEFSMLEKYGSYAAIVTDYEVLAATGTRVYGDARKRLFCKTEYMDEYALEEDVL